MAIKHIVTLGFGFADGVAFIPTLGFTAGAAVTPPPATPTATGAGGLISSFRETDVEMRRRIAEQARQQQDDEELLMWL